MVDKLEAPAALKTGKLTGKANYKYWATVWISYLQSLDLQGLLECCKEEDKAHTVANGTLLGLICETIEPDVMNDFPHIFTDCNSLWRQLKDKYEHYNRPIEDDD